MRQLLKSLPLAALLAVGSLGVACSNASTSAPDYEARLDSQLEAANLGDVDVHWSNDQRELHLTGEVNSEADKARAEQMAQQVVGTGGRVVNEIKVEGQDYGEIDDRIEGQLNRMFEDRTEWDFDGMGVNFDAEQGVVTITGTVESDATKQRITERARAVEGVKDVVNNLEIDPKRKTTR
ncbi:MAG: BON domain-containing protein [Vicinamibacteraceae bacterium]|nr:BON domain-containing protein [Vicinamibacteraceae bacterium]